MNINIMFTLMYNILFSADRLEMVKWFNEYTEYFDLYKIH